MRTDLSKIHRTSKHGTNQTNKEVCGGSIANINADGTFTHVIPQEVVEDEDDY
jgi:hypothetical protein